MMNQYIMYFAMQSLDPSPPFQSEKIPPPPIFFSAKKKDKLFVFRWKDLQISGDFGFKCFFTASLPKSWTSFEPHKGLAVREDMLFKRSRKNQNRRLKEPSAITLSIQHVGQSSVCPKPSLFKWVFVGGFPWTLKVRLANISDLDTPLFSWSSSFESSFREQVPWFQGSKRWMKKNNPRQLGRMLKCGCNSSITPRKTNECPLKIQ